ncbi:hypothetical protein [Micromonospora fluostatini]|uniref:hypothetical protein n=1 Tax=Micromonospora sp. JCM 30529 TaxID=3421643 RepID=UPI003D16D3BA
MSDRRYLLHPATVSADAGNYVELSRADDRLCVDQELAAACAALARAPHSVAQFDDLLPRPGVGERLLSLLLSRGLACAAPPPPGTRSPGAATGHLPATTPDDAGRSPAAPSGGPLAAAASARYVQPNPLRVADLAAAGPGAPRPLRVLLIGGCVLQFAEDSLVRAAARRGLDVRTTHRWPDSWRDQPLDDVDLIVFQPTTIHFLAPLWDDGPYRSGDDRRRRLTALVRVLRTTVTELARAAGDRPVLVHNVAAPAVSPFGRTDFRQPVNVRDIVYAVNSELDRCAQAHPTVLVVDEQALAARHGAAHLLDDLVFPYAHHGGAVDPAVEQPHQTGPLSDLLAEEYVALYLLHTGADRIKCVAVDLDGTLWPSVAAEDGFGWLDRDTTSRWLHLGLHQALRILRHRGILLVSLSKGTEEVTLGLWRQHAAGLPLGPDDFVAHRINWQPKSANLAALCADLGIAHHQVLVLDDHPVERAEIRHALPDVHVLDAPVADFRRLLLSDPRCEVPWSTPEGAARSDTTRAVLARQAVEARAADRADFLRELGIRLTVRPAVAADAARLAELFSRTTQFTTTARPLTEAQVRHLLDRPDAAVFALTVRDRFADYGLTGALVLEGETVTAMAVSCRVLGLDVAVPFLVAAVRAAGRAHAGLRGLVVRTPRNEPARTVFTQAGLVEVADGEHTLRDPAHLADPGAHPGHVEVQAPAATGAAR